jgi:transcriptional regulator with XRE-family HTH domain
MVKTLNDKLATLSPERRRKIEARTADLIAEEMSLRELRRAMGKTRAKVAADLGVGQDSVARYEQRSDMLLSTLSGYVQKVGGTLELTAKFPNRDPIRIKGFTQLSRSGETQPLRKRQSAAQRSAKRRKEVARRSPVKLKLQRRKELALQR